MNTQKQEQLNYLLVCVAKPEAEPFFPHAQKWQTLQTHVNREPGLKEMAKNLCDNVWLFPDNEKGRLFAGKIHSLCQSKEMGIGLSCEVFKVQGKPEPWR